MLPTLFLSHGGGPCFWMDWDPPDLFDNLAILLRGLADDIGERPRAVLVISAHWEEKDFTVQSNAHPPMLFDYYGFPKHTYELEYPAPGDPELASRVAELLSQNKIAIRTDTKRGLDHGVFVPFMLIYPKADIPIVQLSIKSNFDPIEHFSVGKALAPLRREGILIVGSGLTYHNLRQLHDLDNVSEKFDGYLRDAVCNQDVESRYRKLINWKSAPNARLAHPREDHLVPLFVVAGAAERDLGQVIYSERMKGWGFYTSSYQFG